MKKILCLMVAFVLSSSVAFSQDESNTNNSTVSTKSFFDYLISKNSVSIEYRHYLDSKVNDKAEFAGFTGKPQFRLSGKANLFDGILVGGIYVQTTFRDAGLNNGSVTASPDVVDFSLTSPYTSFESKYFDIAFTLSWSPALSNRFGMNYESINGKVESTVKAPSIDLGFATLDFSSAVEAIVHYTPFDKTVTSEVENYNKQGPKPVGFKLVKNENGSESATLTGTTNKSNFDLTVTVLDAKLPFTNVKGLTVGLTSEFEYNYVASVGLKDDGSTKDVYSIDRETRTTLGVSYNLTDNLVISENITYRMAGFYKDSIDAKRWTNLVALKYSL